MRIGLEAPVRLSKRVKFVGGGGGGVQKIAGQSAAFMSLTRAGVVEWLAGNFEKIVLIELLLLFLISKLQNRRKGMTKK
jgi:hypothetical protein